MTAQTELRPRHNLHANPMPEAAIAVAAAYRGHWVQTPEDYIVGIKDRRKTDATPGEYAAQDALGDDGSGKQEAQPGKNQRADAQAVDQRLVPDGDRREQQHGEVQQDQDPTGNPAAHARSRTLAVDRGKEHHEQAQNEDVENFVFHE